MADTGDVRNNEAEGRYELSVEGQLAIAAYDRREGALVFTHTQVPETREGQGVGGRLVKAAPSAERVDASASLFRPREALGAVSSGLRRDRSFLTLQTDRPAAIFPA